MLKEPSKNTLKRYGLSLSEWEAIVAAQEGKCPICERYLTELKTVIDHQHIKGWKLLSPDERKKFVRGILCVRCNMRFVPRDLTAELAYRAAIYLFRYSSSKALEK